MVSTNSFPHRRSSGVARILWLLILFTGIYAVPPQAQGQSAKGWDKRGANAEAREDYDAAFEAYRKAHEKNPKDLRYKTQMERLKFLAASSHVDRGRILKQNGDLNGAAAEFSRAIMIDPSNQTAQSELQLVQQQMAPPQATNEPQDMTTESDILRDVGNIAGPIELQPLSDVPITLHMTEDVKNIFQAIGKAAGLNVIFDPDPQWKPPRVTVDLTNSSLADALRIVCMTSGAFYKPVTSNTIFVAQNSPNKRKDLDQQAVQTFYLTNTATDKDANDVLTALRNLMDPTTKMTLVASQNAIVMRASPDQLLLAEKLIHDLDRTRPEVVVDVAILEVNRDKIRKLGISLPTSFSLTPQASNANSTTSSGGSGSTTTTTSGLTLNSLSKLNATNFAVGISSGTLDAMLSDTDTKVLQNPRLRATDGQKATLKIGQKYPYATGSYGGYGGVGVGAGVGGYGGIGVQTQFQFADIGVNIEMTPTVHADRQITLKMKVEDSTHAGDVTIQQQTEPIFGQRQVEQVIQLMDGEPNILAGIVIQQDNLSVSGTPGLGELPFFKYLFSSQQREKAQDEIVFLLIPHIVRETTLTRLNTRAIDTGTSTAVEIRREASATTPDDLKPINPPKPQPVGQPTSAANAANAAVQEMKKQAAPPTPPPPAATPAPVTAPGTQPQTPPAPRLNRMTPPPSAQPPAQTQPAAPASTSAANAAKAAAPPAAPRASVAPVSTTAPGSQTQVASAAPSPALPAETVPPVAPAQPSGPTPPVSFSVVPPAGNQAVGSTFKVDVNLSNGKDIDSVPIQLQFDPKVLQLVNVDAGSFMGRDGQAVSAVHRDDGNGLATIVVARPPNTTGVSGQGSVATLTFKAVAAGDSNLNLVKVGAINSSQTNIPAVGAQSVVHVK